MTSFLQNRLEQGNTQPLKNWGITSETGVLRDVLIGPIEYFSWRAGNATSRRYLRDGIAFDAAVAKKQYEEMLDVYRSTDVNVHFFPAQADQPYSIYARDSSVMTPWGPIISQMFSPWRRGEWVAAVSFYQEMDIPIYDCVTAGTFEGGDFMLIEPGAVLCGCSGERTSLAGAEQVKGWFEKEGWEFKIGKFDPHFLHMDVQCVMVADKLAAVCTEVLPDDVIAWLKAKNIEFIDVSYKDAMELGCNIVSLGNERVLLPYESQSLKEQCLAHGLKVYDPDISMITKGGGGVHCMCQPLRRD